MPPSVLKVRYAVKQRRLQGLRRSRNAGVRQRYLVIINLRNGRSARATADVLQVHNTTV